MELTSKYITYDDKRLEKMDDFTVPETWWSRHYEYYFASQFLNKKEIILDAGCGIPHPFKYYASKRVKKCFAVDVDDGIKELKNTDKLEFRKCDLNNLLNEFKPETFDKIFCISVLEHIPEHALTILNNFKALLKPDGLILLTIDHPYLLTKNFINLVDAAGLQFAGTVDYEDSKKNAVKGPYNGLKTYTAVLTKDSKIEEITEEIKEEVKEEKVIKPSETKPLYTFETK